MVVHRGYVAKVLCKSVGDVDAIKEIETMEIFDLERASSEYVLFLLFFIN